MIKKVIFIISFAILNLFIGSFVFAESEKDSQSDEIQIQKFSGWKQAETEHFKFIFEEASRETVDQYALIADDAWNKVSKIYSFPPEKTEIYVTDRTNTVNAFTYSTYPHIGMFTSPVLYPTFTFRDDWKKLFFTHELIHHANFNFEDRKTANFTTKLFGSFLINFDFINVNGWALEGLTTVLETELTDGGRGRSPYWELEYKSITLDNNFQSYNEIGTESRPPYGQSYIFGYLIMRSIVDNYGVQALADIERNRKWGGSWEDSVRLVTGKSVQDIYADVRIALAKKYADERKIPEGQIITPRAGNSYFRPLIVKDDGTFISLRTTKGMNAALVKFDPSAKSGRSYLEDIKPEDLNTIYQETILLNTSFTDIDCATADINENAYISAWTRRFEHNPGTEVEIGLYKWNKEDGIKRLTPKNASFFQPSVSRDGNLLVAVQQKGLEMRLVTVDTETGVYTSLLEDNKLSFIEPSVNADGTKVAFLVLDGKRARVAVADVNNPQNYEYVANDGENIVDPSYPAWNSNGNLTFTANYRGRLEQFEVINTENLDDVEVDAYTIVEQNESSLVRAVVSDPIGVTWAYQCEKGILYTSTAYSGDVIKIKPNSEWGKVPEFNGPSMPGEKITFGELMNDYPDFKPYVQLSEIEEPEADETENGEGTEASKDKKSKSLFKSKLAKTDKKSENSEDSEKDDKEPLPVKGKTVKHRSKENIEKAENANSTITELQNEKKFLPLPKPILYSPTLVAQYDSENDKFIPGFGALALAMSPDLQNSIGFSLLNLNYYPTINNITGTYLQDIPVGIFKVGVFLNRSIAFRDINDSKKSTLNTSSSTYFQEVNIAHVGVALPIIDRKFYDFSYELYLISSITASNSRFSPSACSIVGTAESKTSNSMNANFGFDYFSSHMLKKEQFFKINSSAVANALYDFKTNKTYLGFDADATYTKSLSKQANYSYSLRGRYYTFPAETVVNSPDNVYAGDYLNTYSPIILVPQISYTAKGILLGMFDIKSSVECLLTTIEDDNGVPFINDFGLDNTYSVGLEAVLATARYSLNYGVFFKAPFYETPENYNFDMFKFYFGCKYEFERY